MLPILNFYGNHGIDFAQYDYDFLNYHIINVLRQIPIPDDLLSIAHNSLKAQFPGHDLSKFYDLDNWYPISFPSIPGARDLSGIISKHKHITAIGQFGISMTFTPSHIILPSYIHERIDWYSPPNKEKVQAHRLYYFTIIKQFLGDHALYVDERITRKYYEGIKPSEIALKTFEQTLIEHYGTSKKSLFGYPHGKFPKYYIDTFPDIVEQE
jgi:hypothetical protein